MSTVIPDESYKLCDNMNISYMNFDIPCTGQIVGLYVDKFYFGMSDSLVVISDIIYWDTMFGHFMLVFLFGAFSHFSSVVPFYVLGF